MGDEGEMAEMGLTFSDNDVRIPCLQMAEQCFYQISSLSRLISFFDIDESSRFTFLSIILLSYYFLLMAINEETIKTQLNIITRII